MPARPRRTPPSPKDSTQTPDASLAGLPSPIAAELGEVRRVVQQHLPAGYQEVVRKNMIVWEVPKERYPDTYNGQPLWYAALAAEKRYLSLHLMPVYGSKPLQKLKDAPAVDHGKQLAVFKRGASGKWEVVAVSFNSDLPPAAPARSDDVIRVR